MLKDSKSRRIVSVLTLNVSAISVTVTFFFLIRISLILSLRSIDNMLYPISQVVIECHKTTQGIII